MEPWQVQFQCFPAHFGTKFLVTFSVKFCPGASGGAALCVLTAMHYAEILPVQNPQTEGSSPAGPLVKFDRKIDQKFGPKMGRETLKLDLPELNDQLKR